MGPKTFKLDNYKLTAATGAKDECKKNKKSDQRVIQLTSQTRNHFHGLVNVNDLI